MDTATDTQSFDGTIEGAVGLITQSEEAEIETPEPDSSVASEDLEANEADPEDETEDVVDASDDEEDAGEQDEDEDAENEAGQSAPETYTVKVDGEEVQVSLDDLKRGYSGQQYVQRGMQEAAAKRKEAEQVYSALLAERQQLTQLYQQMQQGGIAKPPSPPAKDLFDRDPIGYMEEKMRYDEAKQQYDAQQTQLQQVTAQQTQAQQQALNVYMQQEMEQLKAVIPEFAEPEKASKLKERMVRSGQEYYGYAPEEIGQIMDHRAVRVLNDAIAYREIMAGKSKAEAKAGKGKPVLKPGAKQPSNSKVKQQRERKAQLKKSGRIEDALGLILNQT